MKNQNQQSVATAMKHGLSVETFANIMHTVQMGWWGSNLWGAALGLSHQCTAFDSRHVMYVRPFLVFESQDVPYVKPFLDLIPNMYHK